MLVRYLTHPQVQIDGTVPVPEWALSELGKSRIDQLIASRILAGTESVISSGERKAVETAEPIASALGLVTIVREEMHENDRSATGFLPPPVFEQVADRFFAEPNVSVRGWERAVDAQARIVREARAALAAAPEGDVLFVGHGGVGTLLFCHLAGLPIDRYHDQPAGGGNLFAFERRSGTVLHGWRAMDGIGAAR